MIDLTLKKLKELNIPTAYSIRPALNDKAISFHFFGDRYTLYGDGKGKHFGGNLQVDLFSKTPDRMVSREIIEKLESINYRFEYKNDMWDTTTGIRLYHYVLIFSYIESEVLNG